MSWTGTTDSQRTKITLLRLLFSTVIRDQKWFTQKFHCNLSPHNRNFWYRVLYKILNVTWWLQTPISKYRLVANWTPKLSYFHPTGIGLSISTYPWVTQLIYVKLFVLHPLSHHALSGQGSSYTANLEGAFAESCMGNTFLLRSSESSYLTLQVNKHL